jgi:hypothetical protein
LRLIQWVIQVESGKILKTELRPSQNTFINPVKKWSFDRRCMEIKQPGGNGRLAVSPVGKYDPYDLVVMVEAEYKGFSGWGIGRTSKKDVHAFVRDIRELDRALKGAIQFKIGAFAGESSVEIFNYDQLGHLGVRVKIVNGPDGFPGANVLRRAQLEFQVDPNILAGFADYLDQIAEGKVPGVSPR